MRQFRAKNIALILLTLFIMFFLYIKTQSVDFVTHNRVLDRINHFKQVDATLNQHILEIRQGILPYYDSAVDDLLSLQQIRNEVVNMMLALFSAPSSEINLRINILDQMMQQKQQWFESFKSSNAILNNSLRYLPIATTQLLNILPSNKNNNLRESLNKLLRDIMVFNLTSDAELGMKLESRIKALTHEFKQQSQKIQGILNNYLTHVNVVIKNKKKLDVLMQQLLASPITQRMGELQQEYTGKYNQRSQAVNTYRLLLYGFSVLLLCVIGYILYRLSQTARALRNTVKDLHYQKFAMDEHAIVSIADKDGAIIYANQKFCDISHRSLDELIGQNHRISKSGYHDALFYEDLWKTISVGNVWHGQINNIDRHGKHYWVDTTIVPFMDAAGKPYQYVAIRTDISAIKKAQEQLRIQSTALKVAANAIVISDKDGNIEWVNNAFTQLTGYQFEEAVGCSTRLLKSEKQDVEFYKNLWQTVLSGNVWHGELINKRKDGSLYTEEQTISPVFDENDKIIHFIAIKQDISERKQNREALQDAKNRLETKVEERTHELASINVKLQQEVEERKKAELVAKNANRSKSIFLANMSHELRTPLNSIIGFTGIIKDGMAGEVNEEQARQLEMVYGSARHLLELINDILDLSKVEAGKVEVIKKEFKLMQILQEVKALMQPQADERDLKMQLSGDITGTLFTDHGKLRQVLLNLLSNAVKFTEQGSVSLICQQQNQDVIFEVVDTGIGIKEENLQTIFDAFEQVDTRTEREYEGTGLGLAISKQFIELLGGEMTVKSCLGEGSVFRIVLHEVLIKKSTAVSVSSQPLAQLEAGVCQGKILVVDDDEKTRELLRFYLQDQGYSVITASNGEEAVELARSQQPFAITLDIMMPGQDGWSTLGILKNEATTQHIPVVVVSILDEENLGMSLGAVDYLTKPVDKSRLLNCIATLPQVKEILLVEDSAKDADLMKMMLEPEGYRVEIAKNGAEGLAFIQKQIPDLILLDLMMPEMSGFEVIRHLKSNPCMAQLPVVIVSAKSLTEAEADYLRENTEGLLVKGQYSRDDMLREVSEGLARLQNGE